MNDLILKMSAKSTVARLNIKEKVKKCLSCNKGEGYLNLAVIVIIVVVVGSVIMMSTYGVFDEKIIPKTNDMVDDLFNYKG